MISLPKAFILPSSLELLELSYVWSTTVPTILIGPICVITLFISHKILSLLVALKVVYRLSSILLRFLLFSGCKSYSAVSRSSFLLQFELTGPLHMEFTTRRACVFFWNSFTVGFSCVLPICRWHPKNFSRGSWHNLLLKNTVTPGIVKRCFTNSMRSPNLTAIGQLGSYQSNV